MASRGRLLFDLNEPPIGDDEEADGVIYSLPQKALPSVNHHGPNTVAASLIPQGKVNSNAFLCPSSTSAFKPFNRANAAQDPEVSQVGRIRCGERNVKVDSLSQSISVGMVTKTHTSVASLAGGFEREDGEWSDGEDDKALQESETPSQMDACVLSVATENSSNGKMPCNGTHSANNVALAPDLRPNDSESNTNQILEVSATGDISSASQEQLESVLKQKEGKGIEASYALKLANIPGKRKIDEHKEAMLGKKHNRQTMFLKLEDVKQASPIKSSTPRRQSFLLAGTVRSVREVRAAPQPAEHIVEKQNQKRADLLTNEGGSAVEQNNTKPDHNGDTDASILGKPRRQISDIDLPSGASLAPIPRQSSWKQSMDLRFLKNSQVSNESTELSSQASVDTKAGSNMYVSSKKQISTNSSYQDTSVECLIREVTSEKLWRHPGEAGLQFVPGRFDCVEEYVRVFEPLILEECRAQLYSTWEELTYTLTNNTHAVAHILNVEKRERGWYDVVLSRIGEPFNFKEGDVAVLSTPRPWLFGPRGDANEVKKHELIGRVAGTVRQSIPLETWRSPQAILHFYVGDSYDSSNECNDDHILRKLQQKGDRRDHSWYLTTLGSLATTQHEYIALHAFRRLNAQMQSAILQPSPEQFPNYEQQNPVMPDCFSQEFVEHLNKSFNGPQLRAIQWAATHTAAGTNCGATKKQDPWPFTLVQGPPGTGKTHTVWGMLNVINLVQHQHYYNSLLKSLAPGSYKQGKEGSSDNGGMGSIDEVLQSMDERLFRNLPKLCPKPRILVCAPSNVATDELLTRVLDRGFIDGDMRIYKPDVVRVGVDSQTPPAARAVSVERRAEQVLGMRKDETYDWLRRLKGNEAYFSREIADVQNKLNSVAAAIRAVGVDPDVVMACDQNQDSLLKQLAQVVENRDKLLVEMYRILIVEARYRAGSNYNLEEARACLEASYANEAEIVFTTLSSVGGKLFSRLSHGFDVVVIDEATQASEVGVLPALSLDAARCVLVGDPQNPAAGALIYSRSLFERFQQAGCPTMLLSVQYRMHPQICDFPSRHFYQGRLIDSESVGSLPDEAYYKDPLLRPYLFYDVPHGREIYKNGMAAFHNPHEVRLCFSVYEHLQKTVKSMGLGKVTVGIITPCKVQLKSLQWEFEDVLETDEGKDIYMNTVDAFQGQERDIIIMSCVRASCHNAAFVANMQRMNVALTRAKRALWVIGHANDLIESEDWAALISDAKERNCYMDKDSVPKEFMELKTPCYKRKARRRKRGMRRRWHEKVRYHPECKLVDDEFPTYFGKRNGYYLPPLKMENQVQ